MNPSLNSRQLADAMREAAQRIEESDPTSEDDTVAICLTKEQWEAVIDGFGYADSGLDDEIECDDRENSADTKESAETKRQLQGVLSEIANEVITQFKMAK